MAHSLPGNPAATPTGNWRLVFLQTQDSQNLVTGAPVPRPAAMLTLALAGLGIAGRRRAS